MKVSTYRKALQSDILDFLREVSPPRREFFEDIIPVIVSQLLFYREEGKFLYPDVYLIVDEAALKVLPSFQKYKISEGKATEIETVKKAIKKCAPLCERRWSIYLLLYEDTIEYGLFTAGESVNSEHREDVILTNSDAPLAISIRILRDKLILVRARDKKLLVFFDVAEEKDVDNIEDTQLKFISKIVSSSPEDSREPIVNFLRRLFTHVYRYGHGTLACVIDKDAKIDTIFTDGIFLSVPIELCASYSESSFLECIFELISGMMQSDGVTVFTNDGMVKAYNVFLEVDEKSKGEKKPSGGARSRAYEALCKTNGVISAYMQSQDGRILIHE